MKTFAIALAAVAFLSAFGGAFAQPYLSDVLESRELAKNSDDEVIPNVIEIGDPFTINLSGEGGHSYIRIGVAIQLDSMTRKELQQLSDSLIRSPENDEKNKNPSLDKLGKDPAIHDTIISTVSEYTALQALRRGSRQEMRQHIVRAINDREEKRPDGPRFSVDQIMFTEYVVQRPLDKR